MCRIHCYSFGGLLYISSCEQNVVQWMLCCMTQILLQLLSGLTAESSELSTTPRQGLHPQDCSWQKRNILPKGQPESNEWLMEAYKHLTLLPHFGVTTGSRTPCGIGRGSCCVCSAAQLVSLPKTCSLLSLADVDAKSIFQ